MTKRQLLGPDVSIDTAPMLAKAKELEGKVREAMIRTHPSMAPRPTMMYG